MELVPDPLRILPLVTVLQSGYATPRHGMLRKSTCGLAVTGKEAAELDEGGGHTRMWKTGLAQPGTSESWEGIMRTTV